MSFPLPREAIQRLFVEACDAELTALKPGNVHVHAAGHGMEVRHFRDAARAAAPSIADPALAVGARIEAAVDASFAAAGLNTNLGIVLLCAPLAAAAGEIPGREQDLRVRLSRVLAGLDRTDAAHAYRAIARAKPAGLGRAAAEDVAGPPSVTLREAMALAADRDRIARAYVDDFADIFDLGLPTLARARELGATDEDATTTLHMTYLAAFLDSHMLRKHGNTSAVALQSAARNCMPIWHPVPDPEGRAALLELDHIWKRQGWNPGTTADLVVTTLYAERLGAQSATLQPTLGLVK